MMQRTKRISALIFVAVLASLLSLPPTHSASIQRSTDWEQFEEEIACQKYGGCYIFDNLAKAEAAVQEMKRQISAGRRVIKEGQVIHTEDISVRRTYVITGVQTREGGGDIDKVNVNAEYNFTAVDSTHYITDLSSWPYAGDTEKFDRCMNLLTKTGENAFSSHCNDSYKGQDDAIHRWTADTTVWIIGEKVQGKIRIEEDVEKWTYTTTTNFEGKFKDATICIPAECHTLPR